MTLDFNMVAILIILVGIVALFFLILDKYPMETVSIGLLSALAAIQVFFYKEVNMNISDLLSGFANPGLITVMALLIMAEGMKATGVISSIARLFELENKVNPLMLFVLILICVAILSSVMNNTPIVVMFIPLIAALVEKSNIDISKTLLPLSYVSMLGGMTTLMGSSTNLIGAGIVSDFGIRPIELLDMTIPALIIAIPGIVFTLFVIPRLLPKQKILKNPFARDARQFLAEIEIKENSKLLGLKIEDSPISELSNSNILFVQRGEHAFYPPIDSLLLKKARFNGVQVLKNSVDSIRFKNGVFTVQTKDSKSFQSKITIGAFGKRSELDLKMNRKFIQKKSPYLAVKIHVKGNFSENLIALHNFKGGYCGVSKVEDNSINLCYITEYQSFKKHKNILDFQQQVVFKNQHLKKIFKESTSVFEKPLTISQISFETKKPVENHIIMCGDTAGMIHPLCGNGMGMAITSARLASIRILQFLNGEIKTRESLEKQYFKNWNKQFKTRLKTGHFIARLFRSEIFSQIAYSILKKIPFLLPKMIEFTHGKQIKPI